MTIVEYEKKFTKLVKYALAFVLDEEDKCKCFEGGLKTAIWTPVTTCVDWSNFSKLVETDIRVKGSLTEEEKRLREKRLSTTMSGKEKGKSFKGFSK